MLSVNIKLIGMSNKGGSIDMFAKLEITGTIEIVTGMHIGGSSAFAAIGAVDSPVIKDPLTGLPIIPGSSLKGKMRTLLAKKYNESFKVKPDQDAECILSLFGSAQKNAVRAGRLLFTDSVMSNWEELKRRGLTSRTEVKFENSISRTTAVANPRQIERVVRGSEFPMSLVYEVEDEDKIVSDFQIIEDGIRLLEYDYLGGSGSRGYGKIQFKDLSVDAVVGNVSDEILEECRNILGA